MRKYLAILLLLPATLVLSAIAANVLIDPYAVHGSPRWKGLNLEKPAFATNERLLKVFLARQPVHTVVLGTSRSEVGIDPRSPAFAEKRVANLATSNQPYQETLELLKEAAARGARRAIIGLDFFVGNDGRRYPSDFAPGMYSGISKWRIATSLSTLLDSYNTLRNQDAARNASIQMRPDGSRVFSDSYVAIHGGHNQLFLDTEVSYLRNVYPPADAFGLDLGKADASAMKCVFRIFEFAQVHGIELHAFISPSHAQLWETLYQGGLWEKWEAWKRQLVVLNQLAARDAGRSPFPIVDFSGFNAFTTEPVPMPLDTSTQMRWYIEASHYRPALGELVLQRLLPDGSPLPSESAFGVSLEPSSIESALRGIRSDHARWRSSHQQTVAGVGRAVAASTMSRRRNSQFARAVPGQGCY